MTSWWFQPNPVEKYACQNGFIFPKDRGENKKHIWVATTLIYLSNQPTKPGQLQEKIIFPGKGENKTYLKPSTYRWGRISFGEMGAVLPSGTSIQKKALDWH